ncbi:hypothetical protein HY993_04240 [Candidatus Micrarchaeota archaeon]|nr:hypothetical protein [Candidatus Micrarchaeota archaeon]
MAILRINEAMIMKKCAQCGGNFVELNSKTPQGVAYRYFRCLKCGDEVVDLKQLHEAAKN